MKWKLSLFGYRESDVNSYLRVLAETRAAEVTAIEEQIYVAEETRLRQEILLTGKREEANLKSEQ